MQTNPVTGAVGWQYCSEYTDTDSLIWGFSQTHLNGTGCMDLGDILIMPLTGDRVRDWDGYRSTFDKSTETATPGYYAVDLTGAGVKAELTSTSRGSSPLYLQQGRFCFRAHRPPAWPGMERKAVSFSCFGM